MSVLTYISPFTLNKEALKNFLLSMSLTSSPDECDKNDGTLLTTPPIQQIFCHFTQAAILKPVNRLACLIPSQDASLQASAWLLPTLPPGKVQLHIVLTAAVHLNQSLLSFIWLTPLKHPTCTREETVFILCIPLSHISNSFMSVQYP